MKPETIGFCLIKNFFKSKFSRMAVMRTIGLFKYANTPLKHIFFRFSTWNTNNLTHCSTWCAYSHLFVFGKISCSVGWLVGLAANDWLTAPDKTRQQTCSSATLAHPRQSFSRSPSPDLTPCTVNPAQIRAAPDPHTEPKPSYLPPIQPSVVRSAESNCWSVQLWWRWWQKHLMRLKLLRGIGIGIGIGFGIGRGSGRGREQVDWWLTLVVNAWVPSTSTGVDSSRLFNCNSNGAPPCFRSCLNEWMTKLFGTMWMHSIQSLFDGHSTAIKGLALDPQTAAAELGAFIKAKARSSSKSRRHFNSLDLSKDKDLESKQIVSDIIGIINNYFP